MVVDEPWRPARQGKLLQLQRPRAHSQLQEPEQHCAAAGVSATAPIGDRRERNGSQQSEFLFLLFMYEITYETMNPVEQIWEVFIWSFCYTWKKARANLEAGEAEQPPSFRLCCVYQNN